jgi:hypothetical protein
VKQDTVDSHSLAMDARHSSEQKHTLLVEDAEQSISSRPPHCSVQTHWKTIALIVILAMSNLLLLTMLLVPRLSVASKLPAGTGVAPKILAQIGRASTWRSITTCTFITDAEATSNRAASPQKGCAI